MAGVYFGVAVDKEVSAVINRDTGGHESRKEPACCGTEGSRSSKGKDGLSDHKLRGICSELIILAL